nr:cation/H+ exchanger, cation/H+ exchanger, CPA1 family [Tanacetum cinerariifolium]
MFFKEKEVLIELSLLGSFYSPYWMSYDDVTIFIKGYCTELFCITACSSKKKFEGVLLFKLDMTSVKSEDIKIFKGFDMSVKSWEDEEFDVISITCSSKKKFEGVLLFKLDMTSVKSEDIKIFKGFDMSVKSWEDEEFDVISISKKLWKKLEDLEEAIFFFVWI